MVELQPLQRNDGRGGIDLAGMQLLYRLSKGHDEDADIFLLCGQSVQAAGPGGVDFTAKQGNALGGAARADEVVTNVDQFLDLAIGLFHRLTSDHVCWRFPWMVDDAGHDLQQPWITGRL